MKAKCINQLERWVQTVIRDEEKHQFLTQNRSSLPVVQVGKDFVQVGPRIISAPIGFGLWEKINLVNKY